MDAVSEVLKISTPFCIKTKSELEFLIGLPVESLKVKMNCVFVSGVITSGFHDKSTLYCSSLVIASKGNFVSLLVVKVNVIELGNDSNSFFI